MQIFSLVITLGSSCILVWRILTNSGLKLKRTIPEMSQPTKLYTPTAPECCTILGYPMLFRLFILGASFVIYCLFKENGTEIQ